MQNVHSPDGFSVADLAQVDLWCLQDLMPQTHRHYFHGGKITDKNPHFSERAEFAEYMSESADKKRQMVSAYWCILMQNDV